MARRTNKNNDQSETTEATQTEATAPEASTETTETATEAAPAAPVDLTGFQAAVNEAVEGRNEQSGEIPEELVTKVNDEYRKLDGVKSKNAARKWIEDVMLENLRNDEFLKARAFADVKDVLSAGSGGGTKAPADPSENFIQRMTSLYLAVNWLGSNVPEGVNENWADTVDERVAELGSQLETFVAYQNSDDEDAEEPEVSPVVRNAYKVTLGRGAGGSGRVSNGGPRRDIYKHVEQVMADEETGTFLTVAEIAKRPSTEYGDDAPSQGAISARFFPKDKPILSNEHFEGVIPGDGKARGIRKVA